jgi:large subunit ribosomal protein L23
MKEYSKIIKQAIVSEKSTVMRDHDNCYVFKVAPRANKIEIKNAIEKTFTVKVLDVKTIGMKGKTKRLGRFEGKRSAWKKAIVKLKTGDSIDIYEKV